MNSPYQNYISISENENFYQQITSAVGDSLHTPHSFADDIVRSIQEDSPYALILDGSSSFLALSLIKKLRNRHPLANIPIIVVFSFNNSFGEKLSFFKNISALSIEDVPHELSMHLEIAIDEQFTDRSPDQTHSYSMEFFADLWREGGSATILLESKRSLSIHRGGILSLTDLPKIKQALYSSPPQYKELETTQNGDWISVGTLLWEEAKKYCHSGFLKHRKWLLFVPSQNSFRALELPLSLPTRKLLFSTDVERPLIRRIRELKINIPQIEQDIEILYLLGLYSFQKTESREHLSLKTQELVRPSSLLPKQDWESWLEESLLEQWQKRHQVNPWTALGFVPEKDLSEQLQKRKENLQIFKTLPSSKAPKMLQQVIDHLEASTRTLAFSKHLYDVYGYPEHQEDEENFFQALAFLEENRAEKAVEILQELPEDNIRYQAFLGWALFLSNKKETKIAFELVSLALNQTKTSIFFETIACTIRIHLQQWNIAEKKLRFLLKVYNTEQLRTLLWYCQSRQAPSENWFTHL